MPLLLKHGPLDRAALALQLGCSTRQLQRVLPVLQEKGQITAEKDGRRILYSAAAAPAAAVVAASSSITTANPAEGHSATEASQPGHFSGQVSIVDTFDGVHSRHSGHSRKPIKSESVPNRDRVANRHTDSPTGAPPAPGCLSCSGENANKCRSCPLSYAELERDTIQFVIVDQEFRDRLVEEATLKQWRRKTDRGLTWIYQKNITLQVGGDVVVFYSDEPGDLGPITRWVRQHFAGIYSDLGSLIARIKHPHELSREELTVIITDGPTMEAVRPSLHQKADKTGTFYLKSPNPNVPGFKAYFYRNTLRCEFDCRDEARKITALHMRRRLLQILPAIAGAPGIFDEYLTDYYNPYEHPIVIDTGVDAMMQKFTDLAESLTDKFAKVLHEFVQARPVQAQLPEGPDPQTQDLRTLKSDANALEAFDIDGIMAIFRKMKLEREAVQVYLAAWSVWQSRSCRGRVLFEDISRRLTEGNEPQSLTQIADAVEKLKASGLMVNDPKLEVRFSADGATIAKKLMARWEGVQ